MVIYAQVFERRLTENIRALDFHKILDPANVRRIVEEADGYQPYLIAPEAGYRRLLQECLVLFKGPAEIAVDEVWPSPGPLQKRCSGHAVCIRCWAWAYCLIWHACRSE